MAAEFSVQDIDVEELSITSAVLMGAAHHYGTHCKAKNDAFMQCRMDKRDPRKCLQEGTEVRMAFNKDCCIFCCGKIRCKFRV